MSYTVLARRYRSQTFDDVLGQDAIAHTLKNAIKTEKVAHAYLFTGTRGVGKTTMARILAKSLNCLKSKAPTTKPCCKCDSCVSINTGEDLDVIEIDGASNTGVDNIRQLRQNAIYRPARARYKIYIIDEVHMLSTGAFNALLKILEEPPDHVKFIFATTEPNKILATIQSRCQRFDFNSIAPAVISGQLKAILKTEKIKYEDDLILHLARLANGSMRDALSLLDQLISTGAEPLTLEMLEEFLGRPNSRKIHDCLDKIADSDASGVLTAVDQLLATGQSSTQIVDSLVDFMRDLMVLKSTDEKSELLILTEQERKKMAGLAPKFDTPALIYNITTLEKLRWSIKTSDNPRALLEASLLRLALSEHFLDVPQLLARLNNPSVRAAPNPIKKKTITAIDSPPPTPSAAKTLSAPPDTLLITKTDTDSIKDNWQTILTALKNQNTSTASLLDSAQPSDYRDNILTLSFPPSTEFAKSLCQKRTDQIESLLSAALGTDIKVKFETSSKSADTDKKKQPKASIKEARDEVLNDPAVKILLTGLNATVIQIDEVKDN